MKTDTLLRAVDWFVPGELHVDMATLWRARIFVISHAVGPCLGVIILYYLYEAGARHGLPYWITAGLAALFALLPIGLKLTGRLFWIALVSVVDLVFLSVFASFFYGGVSSPFMPWFLTALLLGFFYLGNRPFLVLGIFAVHLVGFCVAYALNGGFPEVVPVSTKSNVGVISVCAATLYTSMMAIYYANVITAQSELKREADRHQVTAALMREAKDAAERANEAQAVFLAKMSHHLRTPLNAVIGYSEILLEDSDPESDAASTADLKRINSAGRHLLSLVTDVLDMSKIDANDVELLVKRFDIRHFVDDVAATCQSLVARNGNRFVVEAAPGLGNGLCDKTRLRQVVFNLLSNAGKFTRNGTVTLSVARVEGADGDDLVLTVADTGIGMSPESLQRLFTDFNQADASTAGTYGGTGLGLALSRQLCELMNGEIAVTSEVGIGSTFTVRVPVSLHAAVRRSVEQPVPVAA